MLLVPVALTLAAKGLLAAYATKHGGATAPTTGIALAFSWSMLEGAWSSYFQGSNNYGSVHASVGFERKHAGDVGYGMIAMLERAPAYYIARMRVYPSLVLGAGDFLNFIENGVDLSIVQTPQDFSTGLYSVGYFGGLHTPRTPVSERKAAIAAGTLTAADQANIAGGVSAVNVNLPAATAAVAGAAADPGDPSAITVGPPFASLANRLTPAGNYAPHTIDHAVQLLGSASTNPIAGGVSLADCEATPTGDGVWLFGPSYVVPGQEASTSTPEDTTASDVGYAIGIGTLLGGLGALAVRASSRRRVRA